MHSSCWPGRSIDRFGYKRAIAAMALALAAPAALRAAVVDPFSSEDTLSSTSFSNGGDLLTNGQFKVLDTRTVVEDSGVKNHINFPFAHQYANGTISLTYSYGVHTVTEQQRRIWSTDGGLTWQSPAQRKAAINSTELAQGGTAMVTAWDEPTTQRTHTLTTYIWSRPTSITPTTTTGTVTMPWNSQFLAHRTLLEMPDGSWLQTVYGKRQSQSKYSTFLVESKDKGATWNYLSTMATGSSPGSEGFDEPTMTLLADGGLLSLIRTGSGLNQPLLQVRSNDGGKTWSAPKTIADYGVDPSMIRLSTGALVAAAGRPGVYLLVDYTGTGEHWQQVSIYEGLGSSYTSLVELEPGVVGLFYDQSGFNSDDLASLPNRLLMTRIQIQSTGVPEPTSLLAVLGGALLTRRRSSHTKARA